MTATAAPATAVRHPLSRLTAEEIDAVRELVAGTLTGTTRFVYVGLEEPDKAEVLGWTPGTDVDRRVRVPYSRRPTALTRSNRREPRANRAASCSGPSSS